MSTLSSWIVSALRHHDDPDRLTALKEAVESFCSTYPVPGI